MLVFLDVDGTLYSPTIGDIPSSALEAIKIARQNGHKVFLCTGRGIASASLYINLDIDGFVFMMGSLVYVEKKRIFSYPMQEDDVQKMIAISKELNIGYIAEGSAGAYIDPIAYNLNVDYFRGNTTDPKAIKILMQNNGFYPTDYRDERDPIYKMVFYGQRPDHLQDLYEHIPHSCRMIEEFYDHFPYGLGEMFPKEVNKATGIQKVIEHYDLTRDDAIAIGDNTNDIDSIEYCGIGVAMGNAVEELKEKADYVTTDILDDGIWNAFKDLGLLGK